MSYLYKLMIVCAVASTLNLGSCTDDIKIDNPDPSSSTPDLLAETQRCYFSFKLGMADGMPYTRVNYGSSEDNFNQGFEEGSAEYQESAIYNILFIFYDENGNFLAYSNDKNIIQQKDEKPEADQDDTEGKGDGDGDEDEDEDEDEEAEEQGPVEENYWNELITFSVETDYDFINFDGKISYFVIVNYTDKLFLKDNEGNISGDLVDTSNRNKLISLETLKNIEVEGFVGGGGSILMTSAGFFDPEDSDKYKYYGTTSGKIHFYSTPSKARKNPFATVYLERAAAKIRLEKIGQIEPIEVLWGNDVYSLTFLPSGWGIEGEEKKEYLVKHNRELSFYENNSYPSDFSRWINYNDEPYRTFWAESLSFDKTKNKYPATGIGESGLTLNYKKFSELNQNSKYFEEKIKNEDYNYFVEDLKDNFLYTKERTFSAEELAYTSTLDNGPNPYSIPTSFVVTGYYPEAVWVRTDEKDGDKILHPDGTQPDPNETTSKKGTKLVFGKHGFYLRYIDMERSDKDSKDENQKPDIKRYQYRLYQEYDAYGNNELFTALLKEQYTIFIKKIVTFWYADEQDIDTNGKPKIKSRDIITYTPVDETKEYKSGNTTRKIADQLFTIKNTNTIWNELPSGKVPTTASNTYTLQLMPFQNINDLQSLIDDINNGLLKNEVILEKTLEGRTCKDIANEILVFGKYDASDTEDHATYTPFTKAEVDEVNWTLQKTLGYAQYYWKGRAFFYSPISHYTGDDDPFKEAGYKGLFNYEKDGDFNLIKNTDTGKYTPDHKTGDFGVVRNHVYNFKINGISTLGYGIPGEDYIPLPEPRLDHQMYQFDLELKILPWNVFNYQLDI